MHTQNQSTSTDQKTDTEDTLSIQLNGEEIHKPSFASQRKEIDGTPFWMIKTEEGYFIAFAKYRITGVHKSEEECINEMGREMWNKITLLIGLVHEQIAEEAIKHMKELGPDGN